MIFNFTIGDDVMLHKDVFEIYKGMFDLGMIDVWFANGYNSVRVRYANAREVAFTCMNELDWKLESLDSNIMSMSIPKKMTKGDYKKRR
jgi:hypothetical protein